MSDEEMLYLFNERAAILEHDAGLPRDEAEARARRAVYGDEQMVLGEGV